MVTHLHADANGLDATGHRRSLELFSPRSPPGLRRDLPDPPFARGPVSPAAEPQPAGLRTRGSCRVRRPLADRKSVV